MDAHCTVRGADAAFANLVLGDLIHTVLVAPHGGCFDAIRQHLLISHDSEEVRAAELSGGHGEPGNRNVLLVFAGGLENLSFEQQQNNQTPSVLDEKKNAAQQGVSDIDDFATSKTKNMPNFTRKTCARVPAFSLREWSKRRESKCTKIIGRKAPKKHNVH